MVILKIIKHIYISFRTSDGLQIFGISREMPHPLIYMHDMHSTCKGVLLFVVSICCLNQNTLQSSVRELSQGNQTKSGVQTLPGHPFSPTSTKINRVLPLNAI